MKDRILIADDEPDLLIGLERMIGRELDCEILTATSGAEALAALSAAPIDLLLTDVRMPAMDGMELLKKTRAIDPLITIVMMTAHGTIELAVAAIKEGAYEFLTKPFDRERLLHTVTNGLERNRLVRENDRLLKQVCEREAFQNMIGVSAAMKEVFKSIRTMARTDVTVLLLGESGTGKELAARAIHDLSKRRSRRMVTVNCPALPDNILESELFGYRKGAFTGAETDKPGLFEEAEGSTILLDEIGDLSQSLQAKLLRVLQEREIRPLGDTRTRQVDVRVIASTNQDLPAKIKDQSFREDLYYRLNVATLVMPPLSDRREDIPLLVEYFLEKAACEYDLPKRTAPTEVMNHFMARDWPGNIRELENTIRSLSVTAAGGEISVRGLEPPPEPFRSAATGPDLNRPYKVLKEKAVEEFTTAYVHRLLTRTRGNVSLAAEVSGISRQSFQKIFKKYGIDPQKYRV